MRDPRRRNRNIGTPEAGHGSNNRLTIPYRWSDHAAFRELYDAKPPHDKEAFAHRYADAFRREMESAGRIPFPPRFEEETIRGDGLDPAWFARPPQPPKVRSPAARPRS